MTDKQFTLLSVHFHDAPKFVKNVAGAGDDETTSDDETDAAADAGTCPGKTGLKVLVGLLLAVGLAYAAKKLLGDDDLDELEELDEFTEE